MNRVEASLLIAILSCGTLAAAQSLAEVAQKEEARRKAIKVPGRVYTNSDLKPEPTPSPAGLEPLAAAAEAREGPPRPEEKGEAYWRELIRTARAALERSQVVTAALQSRLNALSSDIAARDDPAQRSQLEAERRRVLAELERVNVEIVNQTKAVAAIEEDARKAGVPPGWLR